MTDVETLLRDTFRQHERGVAVRDTLLESAIDRAARRQRHRQVVVAVCVAVAVMTSALLVMANRAGDSSDLIIEPIDLPAILDLGRDDLLPPGAGTILEGQGVFVLRTTDGEITAFSRRAPKQGCRLVLAASLEDFSFSAEVVFHDPCHGQNFDRDGRKIGGPGIRDMYRYDVRTDTGRILVDTSLARPGPYIDSLEGGEMSLDRTGATDELATHWRDALETAAAAVRGSEPAPFVWVLGAFHDSARDMVSVPFTFDGLAGELQIGPAEALPRLDLDDTRQFDLDAGRLVIGSLGDKSVLSAEMDLVNGQRLRFGLLIPTCSGCDPPALLEPDLDDLVELIDRTTSAAAGGS